MNLEAIQSIAEILSAFGVIASLVYVGVQVKQNTRGMHAASIESTITSTNFVREQVVANEDVATLYGKGAVDPDSLTEVERLRFRVLVQSILWTSWNAYAQTRFTGLDTSIFDAQVPFIRRVVSTSGGRWVWREYKDEFEAGFRQEIEQILADE
jgi:hypothetical protein